MIPKWQMIGIAVLVLLLAAVSIYNSPNSMAYAYLSGLCSRQPTPDVCWTHVRYSAGTPPHR
jgi:hypothetical protein